VSDLGAEDGYYSQLASPYKPRNAPMKSLAELELVAGVDPISVRGEDWNLNGRLDPNEDDGDLSPPDDNSDGVLDAGWSAIITTESVDEGLGDLGEIRLDLTTASADQLTALIRGLNSQQAETILSYAQQQGSRLQTLISTPLRSLAGGGGPFAQGSNVQNLDDEAIERLLDLATVYPPSSGPVPGRVNINTCTRKTLEYIEMFRDQGEGLADILILWRDQQPNGFNHILDLLDIPGVSRGLLTQMSAFIDVQSNAYVVTSRGRDTNSGIEVEIVATIERTALPVVITEMQVR
jgi:DNA uptake protein ComE-like DNA-binding protein